MLFEMTLRIVVGYLLYSEDRVPTIAAQL